MLGAEISHESGGSKAVVARLTPGPLSLLERHPDVRQISPNFEMTVLGLQGDSDSCAASRLRSVTGHCSGRTLSLLGKRLGEGPWSGSHSGFGFGVLAEYDATTDCLCVAGGYEIDERYTDRRSDGETDDGSSSQARWGECDAEEAAGTALVSVRAFDAEDSATCADVLRAIDWVVAHAPVLDVRVLDLPFEPETFTHLEDFPLTKILVNSREAGISVVCPARGGLDS
jgi:hypothetical protein